MAVGGVPYFSSLTENLQEQNDEILALESIFEGDEGRLEVLSRASEDIDNDCLMSESPGNALKIMIPVQAFGDKLIIDVYLPIEDQQVVNGSAAPPKDGKLARSESGHRVIWSFRVTYLPPLCLVVTLPPTYPAQDAPSFQLSCTWLSPHQLTYLCGQLDKLWAEMAGNGGPGMPILYTWVDWLQENLLSSLGIESHLSVSTHEIDEDVDDCRVTIETTDMNDIVTSIMRYSRHKETMAFYEADHECEICFCEYLGSNFFLLPGCNHHVCRECLTAHCQLIVKEGNVQQLRCPLYECEEGIPPVTLQAVLREEDFQRYQTLALQRALDTMGDIIYCPRCNNAVVQEPEKDLNLAHCLACFYSFCTDCLEAWHQGSKCSYLIEMDEEESGVKAIKENERQEANRVKQRKKEDHMSYDYVKRMASKCPTCASKIMKTGGCNKVTCTVCGSFMCWCCKEAINGYAHFTDNSKCNTFVLDPGELDNTDLPERWQANPYALPQRFVPRQPRPPPRTREIEEELKTNPDLQAMVLRCSACKVKNIKEGKGNQLVCWNCHANICFHCKQRITGPVGKHYHGPNTCEQHS